MFVTAGIVFLLLLGYLALAIYVISTLMIRPPFYQHHKPEDGLAMSGLAIDPIWFPYIHNPKEDFGLDYNDVEFNVAPVSSLLPFRTNPSKEKDIVLRGWHVPCSSRPKGMPKFGVVTTHGGGRDRREFHRLVPFLNRAQLDVLLFDCREHGISDGNGNGLDWGRGMYQDVLAAALYAKEKLGWDKVICLGTSNGAAMSILAASYDKNNYIDAIIADSPYMSAHEGLKNIIIGFLENYPRGRYLSLLHWAVPTIVLFTAWRLGLQFEMHDIITRLNHVKRHPIFLLHGTKDIRFGTHHAHTLYAKISHDLKEIWIVENGKHTELYDQAPKEYERRVLNFIRSYVGEWRNMEAASPLPAAANEDDTLIQLSKESGLHNRLN